LERRRMDSHRPAQRISGRRPKSGRGQAPGDLGGLQQPRLTPVLLPAAPLSFPMGFEQASPPIALGLLMTAPTASRDAEAMPARARREFVQALGGLAAATRLRHVFTFLP
jgi:hypothetical protein